MWSMTWDGWVKSVPRRDCDYLLFKQVASHSLGCCYLYSFIGWHEWFYNQCCFCKFLKMVSIITSLLLVSFFTHLSPNFPTGSNYIFDLFSTVRSISSLECYKARFLIRHSYRKTNVPSWQHMQLHHHGGQESFDSCG